MERALANFNITKRQNGNITWTSHILLDLVQGFGTVFQENPSKLIFLVTEKNILFLERPRIFVIRAYCD